MKKSLIFFRRHYMALRWWLSLVVIGQKSIKQIKVNSRSESISELVNVVFCQIQPSFFLLDSLLQEVCIQLKSSSLLYIKTNFSEQREFFCALFTKRSNYAPDEPVLATTSWLSTVD